MNIVCEPMGIMGVENAGRGGFELAAAGFDQAVLDFALCGSPWEPEKMADAMQSFGEQLLNAGIGMPIARAPFLKSDAKQENKNELLEKLAAESIRVCGQTGCGALIVKPLSAGIPHEMSWERNREYYLRLGAIAGEQKVRLLLENQCRDCNGHLMRGICSDAAAAAKWVDDLNREIGEDRFGFCMDVGACNLCGLNMHDFAAALGKRLQAVVLRDGNGNTDTAMLPFTCAGKGSSQTDWLSLIRGLRCANFDGQLILDFRDTAVCFSGILKPGLLQLARSVGDYFKWQLEMERVLQKYPARVLFGAGNMCRNYMKCYGELYPPLYTCDNNQEVWDTQFCGLTVKNPECLRNLPGDCGIFICNIYYREVEAQIREMGIQNPIEYFNDEYMPSFYFERLEMRKEI